MLPRLARFPCDRRDVLPVAVQPVRPWGSTVLTCSQIWTPLCDYRISCIGPVLHRFSIMRVRWIHA